MGLRLDKVLLSRGLAPTRSRARDLILRGAVRVDGEISTKAGTLVADSAEIALTETFDYVSRGALKLIAALDAFGFSAEGRVALDAGASTGGFTEVLLERGAAHVFAVDVGRDQLHPRIAAEPRVTSLEGMDARALTEREITRPVSAIVADVSFISLEKALPGVLPFAQPGTWLVALVKPQFEAVRRPPRNSGFLHAALFRDEQRVKMSDWMAAQPGWRAVGVIPSPIEGGSGNQEFLLGAVFDG